ncbi:hypothetical protein N9980_00865 [bacterium]|nr:hypothetical protein [bacterium]
MNPLVIEQAIDHIIEQEGGFTDHPHDRGGPTKYGITIPTLGKWLGRGATYEDIRELSKEAAITIYDNFLLKSEYIKLSDPWTFIYIADMAVLHKPKTLAKIVQKAASPLLKVDGLFGDQTVGIVNKLSLTEGTHHDWQTKLRRERVYYYARRVRDKPTQSAFVLGWIKRSYAL